MPLFEGRLLSIGCLEMASFSRFDPVRVLGELIFRINFISVGNLSLIYFDMNK